jgi:hypothetical protein
VYALKLNVAYAKGIPDCYYSGSRSDLWNEHKKFDTLPPLVDLMNTDITSSLQQMWLAGRHAEGRNVGMIVFSPEGHLFLPGLEWMKPITREEFRSRMKNKKDLAAELIELLGPVEGPILP